MSRRTPRLHSFRTRLTVTFTAAFLTAGIVLLAVVYIAVAHLFDTAQHGGVNEFIGTDGTVVAWQSGDPLLEPGSVTYPGELPTGGIQGVIDRTQVTLRDDILAGLVWWCLGILAVFAVFAAFAASRLSRAALARIADITSSARSITQHQLDARLNLPGPTDEIKELGDTIDQMLDRLEDSFARQREFIANASHELRTPVATARTALEIPLEQGRVPTQLEPAVTRALTATKRSETILNALLDLARAETSRLGKPEPVDLAAAIREALTDLDGLIVTRGLDITVETTDRPLTADKTLIEQFLRNAIINAVRHNIDKGQVSIRTLAHADGIDITISNTGEPVDPDTIDDLTAPFNHGRTTRLAQDQNPGYGLGLAIMKRIIERHNGTLTITARENGGLVVHAHVPDLACQPRRDWSRRSRA